MKALQFTEVGSPLSLIDIPDPTPNPGEVVVDLHMAALNHRDVFIPQGLYPGIRQNVTLGADGAGVINGREVILNPNINWGDDPRFAGPDYAILGMPYHGTFAEKIVVSEDRPVDKPPHLTMAEAAALPLAGLTAYRVLFTRCQFKPSDRVLISGIGGGVALLAFQFAVASGADVWVTSSSPEKIARAVEMGGRGGALYTAPDWSKAFKKETGGFDVIIDSAGGEGFADLVKLTRPAARIGLYGGGRGNWQNVSPQLVFFRQISIVGSTMGTDDEFRAMVHFVNQHKIKPIIDSIFPLEQAHEALARMEQGLQFGKIVLEINP